MHTFFSQFPPLLVSRPNTDNAPNKKSKLSSPSSASLCSTSSLCSVSSDPSFELISRISLRRLPTFSYSPSVSKRRLRSNRHMLPHRSKTYDPSLATEDEEPDSIDQYVSFPSLESLDNENYWDDHQEQLNNIRRKSISELEMERYDEMVVGGVMIKY